MAIEFNDLNGFLFLVLLTIPLATTTNINCYDKPFHCVNATHFMICVDLGGGVISTMDDFVIPCPPSTECHPSNRFECEFPHIEEPPPPLNVIGVSATNSGNVTPQLISSVTAKVNIEETTMGLLSVEQHLALEEVTSTKVSEISEDVKKEFIKHENTFDMTTFLPSVTLDSNYNQNEITTSNSDTNELITTTDKNVDGPLTTWTLTGTTIVVTVIGDSVTTNTPTSSAGSLVSIFDDTKINEATDQLVQQNLPVLKEIQSGGSTRSVIETIKNKKEEYSGGSGNVFDETTILPSITVNSDYNPSEIITLKYDTNEIVTSTNINLDHQLTTNTTIIDTIKDDSVTTDTPTPIAGSLDSTFKDTKINKTIDQSVQNDNMVIKKLQSGDTTPSVILITIENNEKGYTDESKNVFENTTISPSTIVSLNLNDITTTKYDKNNIVTNIDKYVNELNRETSTHNAIVNFTTGNFKITNTPAPVISAINVMSKDPKNINNTTIKLIEQNVSMVHEVTSPNFKNVKEEYTGNEHIFDVTTILPSTTVNSSNNLNGISIIDEPVASSHKNIINDQLTTKTSTDNVIVIFGTEQSVAIDNDSANAGSFGSILKETKRTNDSTDQSGTAVNYKSKENMYVVTLTVSPLESTEQSLDSYITSDNMLFSNKSNYHGTYENNLSSPKVALNNANTIYIYDGISSTEKEPEMAINYAAPGTTLTNFQKTLYNESASTNLTIALGTEALEKNTNQPFSENETTVKSAETTVTHSEKLFQPSKNIEDVSVPLEDHLINKVMVPSFLTKTDSMDVAKPVDIIYLARDGVTETVSIVTTDAVPTTSVDGLTKKDVRSFIDDAALPQQTKSNKPLDNSKDMIANETTFYGITNQELEHTTISTNEPISYKVDAQRVETVNVLKWQDKDGTALKEMKSNISQIPKISIPTTKRYAMDNISTTTSIPLHDNLSTTSSDNIHNYNILKLANVPKEAKVTTDLAVGTSGIISLLAPANYTDNTFDAITTINNNVESKFNNIFPMIFTETINDTEYVTSTNTINNNIEHSFDETAIKAQNYFATKDIEQITSSIFAKEQNNTNVVESEYIQTLIPFATESKSTNLNNQNHNLLSASRVPIIYKSINTERINTDTLNTENISFPSTVFSNQTHLKGINISSTTIPSATKASKANSSNFLAYITKSNQVNKNSTEYTMTPVLEIAKQRTIKPIKEDYEDRLKVMMPNSPIVTEMDKAKVKYNYNSHAASTTPVEANLLRFTENSIELDINQIGFFNLTQNKNDTSENNILQNDTKRLKADKNITEENVKHDNVLGTTLNSTSHSELPQSENVKKVIDTVLQNPNIDNPSHLGVTFIENINNLKKTLEEASSTPEAYDFNPKIDTNKHKALSKENIATANNYVNEKIIRGEENNTMVKLKPDTIAPTQTIKNTEELNSSSGVYDTKTWKMKTSFLTTENIETQTVQRNDTLIVPKAIETKMEHDQNLLTTLISSIDWVTEKPNNAPKIFNTESSIFIDRYVANNNQHTNVTAETIIHSINKTISPEETMIKRTPDKTIFTEMIFTNESTNNDSSNFKKMNHTHKESLQKGTHNMTLLLGKPANIHNREDMNVDSGNNISTANQINIEVNVDKKHTDYSIADKYESPTVYYEIPSQIETITPHPQAENKFTTSANYMDQKPNAVTGDSSKTDVTHIEIQRKTSSSVLEPRKVDIVGNSSYYTNSSVDNNTTTIFVIDKEQELDNNITKIKVNNSFSNLTEHQNSINDHKLLTSTLQVHNINVKQTNVMNKHQSVIYNTNDITVRMDLNIKSNVNNTETPFDCWNNTRGKYADSKDCRKFYICVGNLQPIVGSCPNNTVFSEINKQCTRNLSHCVRNSQFHCLYAGRFSDLLKDNTYFICVKYNMHFLRYKLQCQVGYHLNKATVKCEKNVESSSQLGSTFSDDSQTNEQNAAKPNENYDKNYDKIYVECSKEGKFPYPNDCTKYYVCSKNIKNEYRRKIKKCSDDEVYDKERKKCTSDESNEC